MARIVVTGSSTGIGRRTVELLVGQGHEVVAHARSASRASDARATGAAHVVIGDLERLDETRALADELDALGSFDAVIHNAGLGGGSYRNEPTVDGFERLFQVNVLAPYVLTAACRPPGRLVYLSSGLQAEGHVDLDTIARPQPGASAMQVYSDTKLADVLLAFGVARHLGSSIVHAVDPGWIQTNMGGSGAPGSLDEGADTPIWLATSDDPEVLVTGRLWKERRELEANEIALDPAASEALLELLASLSGVTLPA